MARISLTRPDVALDNEATGGLRTLWSVDKTKDYITEYTEDFAQTSSQFTTTYKGTCNFWGNQADGNIDITYTATHDASLGAVPTFTTAKRGEHAIILVAGTLGGVTVARGDLIQANQDSPTTAVHWDIIQDCTTELETAIEAALGDKVFLAPGVYLVNNCDPDVRLAITAEKGTVILLNRLDNATFHTFSSETFQRAFTTQRDIATVTREDYTDIGGNATDYVSTFNCSTVGHASTFKKNTIAVITCDEPNPYSAASSTKNYLGEAFRVLDSNATTGKVYADQKLRWHTQLAALNSGDVISLNTMSLDRAAFVENIEFVGAPTLIGNSAGWYQTLFGTQVTSTISGSSGSTRTLTSTAHNLANGNLVRVGSVSGTLTTSCVVSNVATNTFDITVPTNKDDGSGAASVAGSGALYYQPVFDRRNSDHHGICLNLQHAPGSRVMGCKFDRTWGGTIRYKHSPFSEDHDSDLGRMPNAMTETPYNINGRLGYGPFAYGLASHCYSYNQTTREGRHPGFTTGGGETASVWAVTDWYRYNGAGSDCGVRGGTSDGAWGIPYDMHEGSNGVVFSDITVNYPNRGSQGGSYFGAGVQIRGRDCEVENYKQTGGEYGIRVAAVENGADSILNIDAIIKHLSDNGNDGAALRVEDHSSITNPPTITGNLQAVDCGWGIYGQESCDIRLERYEHHSVTEKAARIEDGGTLRIAYCVLDYSQNPQGASSRLGFEMVGTCKVEIGTLVIVRGATSSHPSAIFVSGDDLGGKTVSIGNLIYIDPSSVGNIPLLETGREADFTWSNTGRTFIPGTSLRTAAISGNTLKMSAYNTGGSSYTDLLTLTAGATPTIDIGAGLTIGGTNKAVASSTTTSTDNRIARYDGTGGVTVQQSPVTIDDSGNITGVVDIAGTSCTVTTGNITTGNITTGNITTLNIGSLSPTANLFTLASVTGLSKVEYGITSGRIIKYTFSAVSVPVTFTAGAPDTDGYGTLDLGTLPAALFTRGGGYYMFTTVTAGANITTSDTFFVGFGTSSQTTANAGTIVANGDNLFTGGGTVVLSSGSASNQSNSASTGSMTAINGITSTRHVYLNLAGVSISTASSTMAFTGTLWLNVGYIGLP